MDPLTLIISLALISGVLLFVLYPLWQQNRSRAVFQINPSGQTLEEYQARYEAALAAIKDLMFDYEMGKVSTEDYEPLLNKTKLEAAALRRQIDRLSQQPQAPLETALDAEIERLVARMKNGSLAGTESLLQEIETEIEILKNLKSETRISDAICSNCGKTFQAGDVFCSGCGHSLKQPEVLKKIDPNTCPNCGRAFQPGDAFCAKCGAPLPEEVMSR